MEVYNWTPDYTFTETIEYSTLISTFASGVEQRRKMRQRPLRSFKLQYNLLDQDEVDEIWEFFKDRYGSFEAFLFRNYPNDYYVHNEAVLPAFEANTYNLGHLYIVDPTMNRLSPPASAPIITAGGVVQSPATDFILDYDTGTIVFDEDPGLIVRASYEFYYKVRFTESSMSRELFEVMLYRQGVTLKEVFPL